MILLRKTAALRKGELITPVWERMGAAFMVSRKWGLPCFDRWNVCYTFGYKISTGRRGLIFYIFLF
jgi:hypothetical protein